MRTPVVFDCSDPGCVSADTEFLTPTGWKRIDRYVHGDLVAQFHPDEREIEFVEPLQYVKKPCDTMIHISPARGTSQRLSPEHRILFYRDDGTHGVCSAEEFMTGLHKYGPNHFKRKFCTTFSVRGRPGIDLNDAQIRLMVAVIADGHFQTETTDRCVVRLKKARKIERMQMLLAQAKVPYKQRTCGGQPDYQVFSFAAPRHEKEFSSYWWGATQTQLEVIAAELQHWDSSVSSRPSSAVRFSSHSQASAEFAQYAFAAAKRPASLTEALRVRVKEGRGVAIEYSVHAQAQDKLTGPGRKDSVYAAPNPEGFKYCFEVPSSFLLLRHNGHIFATGNTGKTFVRIKVFEQRWIASNRKHKALVLAPKSLLRSTWLNDFKKFAPDIKVVVVTADNKDAFDEEADVYVTNIDAVKWIADKPKKFFQPLHELIVDESSAYKHATSQRSKAVAKLAKHFEFRACMTGTPNGRSITDVWHQVFILDGGKRLGPSFYGFRNSVCEPTQVGRNANAIQWKDKDGAEEAVFGLLQDIVIRHKFEECVDIPPNHKYTLAYDLTPKHRKAYEELETSQLLLYNKKTNANTTARLLGKKPEDIGVVSAVNAAVLAGKLLQAASGAVYSSEDEYHSMDEGRYKLILDLVEERQHSLVFFHWKHQRDLLAKEAEKRGVTFCVLDGSVSDLERQSMVAAYQMGKYQVMLAHPKSAAHGLTLTRGTTTIWASPTYDAEVMTQGSKRQHRIGQTKKTETITIIAPGTIDERVYEILEGKNKRMTNLLDLFESIAK